MWVVGVEVGAEESGKGVGADEGGCGMCGCGTEAE